MSKPQYFRANPSFSSTGNVNVDRENGVIKNTKIAMYGRNLNDSFFDNDFLNGLVKQGNANESGIKCRFGHPNMCATSFGTYVGRYRNHRLDNGIVFADLFLDPVTKKTQVEGKGITMYEYIMDMAESNPDMFGNSICVFADEERVKIDGNIENVLILDKYRACDLVDDPAATDTLFSQNPDDLGLKITKFFDENPQVMHMIANSPEIVESFFQRYLAYFERNFNKIDTMKFKKRDAGLFSKLFGGKKFDIDITLADGSIVTVKTDADTPAVGDEVVDADGKSVEDDTHVTADGTEITTVGGKITEIKDNAGAGGDGGGDNPPADQMQEIQNSIDALTKNFEKFQGTMTKGIKGLTEEFETFKEDTNKKFGLIEGKNFEEEEIENPNPPKGGKKGGYDPEAAKEFRNKKEQK